MGLPAVSDLMASLGEVEDTSLSPFRASFRVPTSVTGGSASFARFTSQSPRVRRVSPVRFSSWSLRSLANDEMCTSWPFLANSKMSPRSGAKQIAVTAYYLYNR
jgi:hypothetical protein